MAYGGLSMPRPILALVAFALALAAPALAHAEELGVVVERTTPTQLSVPVVLQSDRRGTVEVTVLRIGDPRALIEAGVPLGDGNALAWLGTGRDADRARRAEAGRIALYRRAQVTTVTSRRLVLKQANTRHLEPLRLPDPGLYLIEASMGQTVVRATALVSDLALVVKREPDGLLAWAVPRSSRTRPRRTPRASGGSSAPCPPPWTSSRRPARTSPSAARRTFPPR
jgi:hypothetical protein